MPCHDRGVSPNLMLLLQGREDYIQAVSQIQAKLTILPSDLRSTIWKWNISVQTSQVIVQHEDQGVTITESMPFYSKQEISEMQHTDPTIKQFLKYWNVQQQPSHQDQKKEGGVVPVSLLRQWDRICQKDGLLYRIVQDPQEGEIEQLILPKCLQKNIMQGLHGWIRHQGLKRTLHLLRTHCYWPGMHEDITSYVKSCERCVLAKIPYPRIWTSGNLLPSRPLEVLANDFTVVKPASSGWEKYPCDDGSFHQTCTCSTNQGSECSNHSQSPSKVAVPTLWSSSTNSLRSGQKVRK